jgi:hypothetical protein
MLKLTIRSVMSDLPGGFDQILTLITPTVIIALIGITVSLITFFYRRKQLQLNGLIEIIRDLHLPAHKEARNITYHGKSAISEETFGILGLESGHINEAIKLSREIVRNDLNNAATLIRHKLVNESIFLQEYWWIVLRTWDSLEVDILTRRNAQDGSSGYMLSLEKLKDKAENYANKHHRKDFEDYKKKYR